MLAQGVGQDHERSEHEEHGDHGVAPHPHGTRPVRLLPPQHQDRGGGERVERENRHHELIGELLEGAHQHEPDPQ